MRRGVSVIAILASLVLVRPVAPALAQTQIEAPAIPDPVPVSVDSHTTALVVSDLTDRNCSSLPSCVDEIPNIARLLERARAAGVLVAYTVPPGLAAAPWMAGVEPLPDEPVFVRPGPGSRTWFGNELDTLLEDRGTDTVILVGSQAAGIVLDGAFWASYGLGYTVVAPVDGMPSPTEFRLVYTEFQVLNQPGGRMNPNNNPLEPGATTLSRTDLITFE